MNISKELRILIDAGHKYGQLSKKSIIMKPLVFVFAILLFTSCSSDLEKYEKEVASCMKDTKKRLKTEYSNMDKAIAGLDFEIAYKFYSCYQPAVFRQWGERSCETCPNADINPKKEAGIRLSDAQVTYLIGLNEFDNALAVHDELVGNKIGKIKLGYSDLDGVIGADVRFQIVKKAIYYYLEIDDKSNATKWAKRAPNDLNTKGVFVKDKKESQQDELLKIIKEF